MLRAVGVLADRLGKEGLRDLGFDVPVGRITAHQFMASYRVESQLPSMSDITRADDIHYQINLCQNWTIFIRTIQNAIGTRHFNIGAVRTVSDTFPQNF